MKENNLQNQKANQNQKSNEQVDRQAPNKGSSERTGANPSSSRDSQFNQDQAGRQQQNIKK